jgi:hippurate hydrolase
MAVSVRGAEHPWPLAEVDALYPQLEKLYVDLHQNPELSLHEEKTAAKLAGRLRALGFEVTEHVGGTGIVGVLRNGPGPTVMLRTELDALPIEEQTGLPFGSRVKTRNDQGVEVSVMHACGHDIHMTCWSGAVTILARAKDRWRGTLVAIGQPAEERAMGAKAMLADGLFTKFPRPAFAVAFHDAATLPAGNVGYTSGPICASADSVDLTIYGRGGHGANPHLAVDPILIAARTVVTLQSIVSRETNPLDPAVVTVGSIHGGTKHNIIPDEVKLQITVRAYRPEVRNHVLEAIARIARAEAQAAGAPREPVMEVVESCPVTVNDPALTERSVAALRLVLGEERLIAMPPRTVSEDFSEYGLAGASTMILDLGAIEPGAFAEARRSGRPVPGLHTAGFAPDREPTIKTGVRAEVAVLLELLGKP